LPARSAGHDTYEALLHWIETAHQRLAARIEAKIAAAASAMDALKPLVSGAGQQTAPPSGPPQGEQANQPILQEIGKLSARLDRAGESLAVLSALERSLGDISVRFEELRRSVLSLTAAVRPDAPDETPSRDQAQAILREILSLRSIHEESARRADGALTAIQKSLENIASLGTRRDSLSKEERLERCSGVADPFDPFVPVLSRLKERGENAALPLTGGTGSDSRPLSKEGPAERTTKQHAKPASEMPGPGNISDAVGFLIEPGHGFPQLSEIFGASGPAAQTAASESLDHAAGRIDFIAAARRAARMAQAEPGEATADFPAPDSAARRPRVFPSFRGFFSKIRRPAALVAAILITAASAYAIEQILIRAHLADPLMGLLKQRSSAVQGAKPAAPSGAPAGSSAMGKPLPPAPPAEKTPAHPPVKDEAAEPEASSAPAPLAKTTPLDPFAPVQSWAAAGGAKGQLSRTERPIAGSDAILAEALQPAARRAAPRYPPAQPVPRTALPDFLAAPGESKSLAEGIEASRDAVPEKALMSRAEAGDVAAQIDLAIRYAEGQADERNYQLAARWFARAAQQGSALAQYRLAALYEKGLGVGKDVPRAKDLYQQAAEKGNIRAMHNLGVLAADGADGKPNYPSAVFWFAKAADYGITDSQYNLAVLLARGLGTPKDLVRSYSWFAIVAAAGDAAAARNRDEVAARLTTSELAAAKAAAAAFAPRPADPAANEAPPPQEAQQAAPAQGGLIKPTVGGL
jgi:localization factor PodJL